MALEIEIQEEQEVSCKSDSQAVRGRKGLWRTSEAPDWEELPKC